MLSFAAAHQAGWLGKAVDAAVAWLLTHAQVLFQAINGVVLAIVAATETVLQWPSAWFFALLVALLGLWRVNGGFALFVLLGLNLVLSMDLWAPMITTLSLVLAASLLALIVGLPLGILSARHAMVWRLVRPGLDLMQTMPAFVYLIPAVMLFSTGAVPSIIATLIFAMPPVVRLTQLGLSQVPADLLEAEDQAQQALLEALAEPKQRRWSVHWRFEGLRILPVALRFAQALASQGHAPLLVWPDAGAAALARRDGGALASANASLQDVLAGRMDQRQGELLIAVTPQPSDYDTLEQVCERWTGPVVMLNGRLEDAAVGIGTNLLDTFVPLGSGLGHCP